MNWQAADLLRELDRTRKELELVEGEQLRTPLDLRRHAQLNGERDALMARIQVLRLKLAQLRRHGCVSTPHGCGRRFI